MPHAEPAQLVPSVRFASGRDGAENREREGAAVWAALNQPLPTINSKYFYDDRGSHLFEAITRLPEYYQTRTEEALLEDVADEIVRIARPRELVELGSGAGRKIRILLDAIRRVGELEGCVLLDINESFLRASATRLATDYPGARVRGVVGDFLHDLGALGPGSERLFIFLAGTIGNLHPIEMRQFLARIHRTLGPRDRFLVGVDLVKDRVMLEAAYNDAAGVTAEFNRNILRVLSRRFGIGVDVEAFEHVAFFDPERSWIEMRLRATQPTALTSPDGGPPVRLDAGDEIRTELSCKFTSQSLAGALEGTGLKLESWFTDPHELFALALVRPV